MTYKIHAVQALCVSCRFRRQMRVLKELQKDGHILEFNYVEAGAPYVECIETSKRIGLREVTRDSILTISS